MRRRPRSAWRPERWNALARLIGSYARARLVEGTRRVARRLRARATGCASPSPSTPASASSASASASTALDQRGRVRRHDGVRPVQAAGQPHLSARAVRHRRRRRLRVPRRDRAGACHFDVGAADAGPAPARGRPRAGRAGPSVELRLYEGDPRPVLPPTSPRSAACCAVRRTGCSAPWMSANDWNTQARRRGGGGAQRPSSACRWAPS